MIKKSKGFVQTLRACKKIYRYRASSELAFEGVGGHSKKGLSKSYCPDIFITTLDHV